MENKTKYSILRCDKAGTYIAIVGNTKNGKTELLNARKIYYWEGANTVEDIATFGTVRPEGCRLTVTIKSIIVRSSDIYEEIIATEEATRVLLGIKDWTASQPN
ncbi:hypothetical protein KAU11_10550 [Candidatus Babeliales bacterium]|nr:hypothetical protein [Candidatus Babeliales bacterium]